MLKNIIQLFKKYKYFIYLLCFIYILSIINYKEGFTTQTTAPTTTPTITPTTTPTTTPTSYKPWFPTIDNKLNKDKNEKINGQDIKTLSKKKPVSITCFKDEEDDILNQKNSILPNITFSDKIYNEKQILNLDIFENLLKKIKKRTIKNIRFREIKNPETNIWKKGKKTYSFPKNKLNNLLLYHKSKIDKQFFNYISNNNDIGINCPNYSDCKTTIIKPNLIRVFESKEWYKVYLKYSYSIKDKAFVYVIFSISYINKFSNDIKINTISLVGLIPEDQIKINSGYTKKQVNNLYNYELTDVFKPILTSKENQEDILTNKVEKYTVYRYNEPICIGSKGNNKVSCESSINSFGESKTPGSWDKGCTLNTDCPFYKANKNYTNTRGGCINEICEMPLNIKQIGPTTYDKSIKPFCHNCPENNPTCCDLQENPDYAFLNDRINRLQNKDDLLEKNLKI
tara:strand:- start:200 stop:1564 length:1365 start_codon:yes stop_codon:yes gene_type:complete